MDIRQCVAAIEDCKIVAVIRGKNPEDALDKAHAAIKGGVRAIEVTFTVPKAETVIAALCAEAKASGALIGAGTVTDAQTAREALAAGARFIVGPAFCEDVAAVCEEQGVLYVPGVYTPTEIVNALRRGCPVLKLFPADLKLLKALRGPFPSVRFMTTGGVNYDNLQDWFAAGAAVVGAGSNLTAAFDRGASLDETAEEIARWVEKIKNC